MRTALQYILCSLFLFAHRWVKIRNSHIRLLRYTKRKGSTGNVVEITDSSANHCIFLLDGNGNRVVVDNGANINNCEIYIWGNNNTVHINGSCGALIITLRGNDCSVYTGKQFGTHFPATHLYCMGQGNSITIGDDCMFAEDVEIWNTDSHLITDLQGNPLNPSKPVSIGNHVWLGKSTKILKGVTIGDNAVVGMCSVVTRNIPANSIVVGSPAHVVKENITWHKGFIKI